jgi:hypothetical protein
MKTKSTATISKPGATKTKSDATKSSRTQQNPNQVTLESIPNNIDISHAYGNKLLSHFSQIGRRASGLSPIRRAGQYISLILIFVKDLRE